MPSSPSVSPDTARIFVQIASYRDTECQHTVRDLFEQAAFPDRISVGICWQYDPIEDADCFRIVTRPDQVRIYPAHWKDSKGISWARNAAQQLWDGEDYVLMIDSHMRFIPNWDVEIITELHRCPSPKPFLSCSPAQYTPPYNLEPNPKTTIRRTVFFDSVGGMRFKGMYLSKAPEQPIPAAFVAGGFMFCSSRFIEEIPYDPYMYHDEAYIAVRLFTHGWDIFSPTRQFTYHYYRTDEDPTERKLFFKDRNANHFFQLGQKRFDHVLGYKLSDDPEITRDLNIYGLGKVRSLEEYTLFSGVNYATKKLSERALRCKFIPNLDKYITRVMVPELDDPKKKNPKLLEQLVDEKDLLQGMPAKPAASPQAKPKQKSGGTTSIPPLLVAGSFLPFFHLPDQEGKDRQIQFYGGKPSLLFFLPADEERVANFFSRLKSSEALTKTLDIYQQFVLPLEIKQTSALHKQLKTSHHLWADGGEKVAHALGISHAEGDIAMLVLGHNLQLLHYAQGSAETVLETGFAQLQRYLTPHQPRNITSQAPVLLVKNAFTPELCDELIEYWHNNEQHQGKVGAGKDTQLRTDAKIRTDCFITDKNLHKNIDERLIHSLFPEIEKAYGLQVTRREDYKVGCYAAEDGGFFKAHRDNFDRPLSYRRFALTLVLNEGYEGGHLLFPEYTRDYYKLRSAEAVVFPCSLMHQVTPITKGKRYVMISFFYAEPQAAHRAVVKKELRATAPPDEWAVLAERPQNAWDAVSRFDNLPRKTWKISYDPE